MSRSRRCDSAPGCTHSQSSACKKKKKVKEDLELLELTVKAKGCKYWYILNCLSSKIAKTIQLKQSKDTQLHSYLAVLSIVSRRAGTAVGAQAVSAGASILAGLRVTFILLKLTERSVKTRTATARKGVDIINASPIIQA